MKKISCSIVALAAALFFGLGAQQTAMAVVPGRPVGNTVKSAASSAKTGKKVAALKVTGAPKKVGSAIASEIGSDSQIQTAKKNIETTAASR